MSIVKLNNRAVRSITAFGSLSSGAMTFIKKLTASSSSTLSFVDGSSDVVLDNTYKEYLFTFKNIHPSGTNHFQFNGSSDSGSNYNVTKSTTLFTTQNSENSAETASVIYQSGDDIAQGTGFQDLMAYGQMDADNDHSLNGTLHLFNPSNTTFVKHFIATTQANINTNYCNNGFIAGYFNTTSAIDAIQFKMDSGTVDAGDICLYGIN
tara:strand:- start:33 stop:656 length:624 start_codon:yes stop_codon:yes gene_type:complete